LLSDDGCCSHELLREVVEVGVGLRFGDRVAVKLANEGYAYGHLKRWRCLKITVHYKNSGQQQFVIQKLNDKKAERLWCWKMVAVKFTSFVLTLQRR
jgi:hypothetical protein